MAIRPSISVVVPVLDEGLLIAAQLEALLCAVGIHEIIVVDGGSCDDTRAIAESYEGVRVLRAARGRASQMNAGAAAASGDVLLFLHADVELPHGAARTIAETMAEPGVIAGAFRTWTVCSRASRRSWMAPLLHLADLRSRYSGLPYGDQALFVCRRAFARAGGYPDVKLMEDLALAKSLRRIGRIRTVRRSVRVSGRRFQARPIYYTVLVNVFPLLYRAGVPAGMLQQWYSDVR